MIMVDVKYAPRRGVFLYRSGNAYIVIPAGGGVPEAPIDGEQYARQNQAWSKVRASVDADDNSFDGGETDIDDSYF